MREDNAADRLLTKGRHLGLIPSSMTSELEETQRTVRDLVRTLESITVKPGSRINELLVSKGAVELHEALNAAKLLKRPEISMQDLVSLGILDSVPNEEISLRLETEIKYEGYIERQNREVSQFKKMEKVRLPVDIDYDVVQGLSTELREKLKAIRPQSLGQASRVPGITPAALSALMVRLRSQIPNREISNS